MNDSENPIKRRYKLMMAMIIAAVVFVIGFINGVMPLHNGELLSIEIAAWSLVSLIAFSVMTTKALGAKKPSDIFKE